MPIETDVLLAIAEIAVGLIGVSGIIAVFVSRGGMHVLDRMRFVLLVLNGMLVVVSALLPIWIARYVADPEAIWRYASLLGLIVAIGFFIPVRRYQQKHDIVWLHDQAMNVVIPFVAVTGTVFLALNIVSWPVPANPTFYEISLVFTLIQVSVFFVALAIYRPDEDYDT